MIITSTFRTSISPGRLPAAENAATRQPVAGWREGLPLILAVTTGGPLPVISIRLGALDLLGGPDAAGYADLVAAPDDALILNFDLTAVRPIACQQAPATYLQGSVTIDASGADFSGEVASTCADLSGTGVYGWVGHSDGSDGAAMIRRLKAAMHPSTTSEASP